MIGDTNVRAMPVAAGTQISTLEVGTLVKMNLQGAPWEWRIVHQGLPSSMYDSSCNGTWLLLKDIYTTMGWDSSNNDYKNSDIHFYLNVPFLDRFNDDIKNAIKQVKIPYVNGTGPEGSVASGANGLSCKIFLLSGYEVGFSTSDDKNIPADGAKLSYFSSGTGSAANNKRIANYMGIVNTWGLRSPDTSNTHFVWDVSSNGNYSSWYYDSAFGVRPALILPSEALVDDELNVLSA